jgi:hypothetical protein
MKYMLTGGYENQPLMRLTLGLTLVFLVFFVATGFTLYFSKMSLDPASVVEYYNGSEEDFRPARSFGSMVEVSHAHLAMMALVLLMLTHLFIFAPFAKRTKIISIVIAFVSGLLDEGGGWLVRFVDPAFALLKVIGFIGLQGTLIFLLATLGIFVFRSGGREHASHITLPSETVEDVVDEEEQIP